ncbi:MAG: hypothetical protein M1828_000667 [Chrysothrix sp. TS-e1954]|nr:MAG: hypothetical protein M1828_000667 [Chrysothrix sp. TS-e1954]
MKVLSVFTFLLFALCARFNAFVATAEEICDGRLNEINSTSVEYGRWLNETMNDWRNTRTERENFPDYMRKKYAPHLAKSAYDCRVDKDCSPIDCELFLGNRTGNATEFTASAAYYTMEAVANFNGHIHLIREANTAATADLALEKDSLVSTFSDLQQEISHIGQENKKRDLKLHAGMAATLIGTALAGIAAIFVPGVAELEITAVAAGSPFIGPALAAGLTSIGPTMGAFGGGYAGVAALMIDKLTQGTATIMAQGEADLSKNLGQVTRDVHAMLDDVGQVLVDGYPYTASNGQVFDISTFLTQGAFKVPVETQPAVIQKRMEQQWLSTAINAIWMANRAYIIDADVEGSSCEHDQRVPPMTLPLIQEDDGDNSYPAPGTLPGFQQFLNPGGYRGITAVDIVNSSVAYYEKFGHQGPKEVKLGDIAILSANSLESNNTDPLHGGFTIPVCRNNGNFITSVWRHGDSRNYPCMCGEFDLRSDRSIEYDRGKDETPRFMEMGHFERGKKYRDYCSHRMDCDKDPRKVPISWGPNIDASKIDERWKGHDAFTYKKCDKPSAHDCWYHDCKQWGTPDFNNGTQGT